MDIERLKKQIKLNEGIRKTAYQDTLGNWTIGVGHLIKLPDEEYLIDAKLNDLEVDQIFITDLNQAIDDARKFIDADSIPDEAFEVVVDMAFNLGLPKLLKFKNFQQALKEKDFVKASEEMLDSLWAKQVPNRANELALMMEEA
jgi:lysozyme